MPQYQTDVDHAQALADAADEITMRYYRSQNLRVDTKPDNTPVTEADTATEKRLRDIVVDEYKEHYLGEEGARAGVGGRLWIVDPIDGTKNYMRGVPLWGTLIALNVDGETVAACVSAPAMGRRWWAGKGLGAWTRDVDGTVRTVHVSGVSRIADAFLLASTPLSAWDSKSTSSEKAVQTLLDSAWRYRLPGDMINYMWVAEGAADACFEPYAKQWDVEACKLIITEAGGSFWTTATAETPAETERVTLATNGHLETPIRTALGL
jgi:histidinol-phosphatase